MNLYKRIISLFLVFAICISSMVTVAFAADDRAVASGFTPADFSSAVSYGAAIDENFGFLRNAVGYLGTLREAMATGSCDGCTVNPDGRHNFLPSEVLTTSWAAALKGGEACICRYCGITYNDFYDETYNAYLSDLQTDFGTAFFGTYEGSSAIFVPLPTIVKPGAVFDSTSISKSEDGSFSCFFTGTQTKPYTPSGGLGGVDIKNAEFIAPVNAQYIKVYSVGSDNGWTGDHIGGFINTSLGSNVVAGKTISSQTLCSMYGPQGSSGCPFVWNVSGTFYGVFVLPEGSDLPILQEYNSRPASIVGDYGIIGDDGTIIKVDGNMIVDESTSMIYNPVTNNTYNYTDYAFDYSDRSYNLTLEDGSSLKVIYGDENITIHEGDTVYNVYYIIESGSGESGGESGGEIPDSGMWSWWKEAWQTFTDKLFSVIGGESSSVNPDTAPVVPDDEETGEKGYSVIDLFVVLKDGTWAFITGIVSTAYDGFTGFVESVSSAGSFFTFYDEESEDGILFVPLEGGETIWD